MNCVYRRFTQFSAAMLCRRRPVWTTTSLGYRRHRPNRDAELVEGMGDFDEEDLVQRRGQEEVLFDSVRVDGSEWMRRTDERARGRAHFLAKKYGTELRHFPEMRKIEPNLLTFCAKEQVCFLHKLNPHDWSVERLANCFPASERQIAQLIKRADRLPPTAAAIKSEDEAVARRWKALEEITGVEGGPVVSPEQVYDFHRGQLSAKLATGIPGLPALRRKRQDDERPQAVIGPHYRLVQNYIENGDVVVPTRNLEAYEDRKNRQLSTRQISAGAKEAERPAQNAEGDDLIYEYMGYVFNEPISVQQISRLTEGVLQASEGERGQEQHRLPVKNAADHYTARERIMRRVRQRGTDSEIRQYADWFAQRDNDASNDDDASLSRTEPSSSLDSVESAPDVPELGTLPSSTQPDILHFERVQIYRAEVLEQRQREREERREASQMEGVSDPDSFGSLRRDFYHGAQRPARKVPTRIRIPQHLKRPDAVYKKDNCFYDHTGTFLYRV